MVLAVAAKANNATAQLGYCGSLKDQRGPVHARDSSTASSRWPAISSYVGLRHVGPFSEGASFVKQDMRQMQTSTRKADCGRIVCKTANTDKGRFYLNITGFPFPLNPFAFRRTVRTEVSELKLHARNDCPKLPNEKHSLHCR